MEATLSKVNSQSAYNPACPYSCLLVVGDREMAETSSTARSLITNHSVPGSVQGQTQCTGSAKKTEPQEFTLADYCLENFATDPMKQMQNTIQPTTPKREYTQCTYNERGESQLYNPPRSHSDAFGDCNVAQAPSATHSPAINHSTLHVAQGPMQIIGSVNVPPPQVIPPVNRLTEALANSIKQMQGTIPSTKIGMSAQNMLGECSQSNQFHNPPYSYSCVFENLITTQASSAMYSLTVNHPTPNTSKGNVQVIGSVNVPVAQVLSLADLCVQNVAASQSGPIQSQGTIGTRAQNMPDESNESDQLRNQLDSYNCVLRDRNVTQAPSTAYSLGINHSNLHVAQGNVQVLLPPPDPSVQTFTGPTRQVLGVIQPTSTIETRGWLVKSEKKKNRINYILAGSREWKELREKEVTHCPCCDERLETFCLTCEVCSLVFCTLMCVKNYDKCSNGVSLCKRLRLLGRSMLHQGKLNTSSTVTGSPVIHNSQSTALTQDIGDGGRTGRNGSSALCKSTMNLIYIDSKQWKEWRSRGAIKCLTCAQKFRNKAFFCCNACTAWYCTEPCMKHHKVC